MSIPPPRKLVGGLTALRDVNLAWTPRASWVAAGAQGIVVSNDGMTWTPANNNPFTGAGARRIAWNGLYWVAVGGDNSIPYIARSSDGLTWTLSTNNPFSNGNLYGIAWNGSYWVAVGLSSGSTVTIAKSTDGLIWTPSTNNPFPSGVGYGIAWNGTYWLAGGSGDSGTMAISSDGMNWTPTTSLDGNDPFILLCYDVAWNGSYWVASGNTSYYNASTAKSTDGINWVSANPFPYGSGGIAWNGSYWVAIGANADPSTICIVKSTDGATWTPSTNNPFTGGGASGIAWNGSYWIATGNNGANTVTIAKSFDGMTWTPSTNNLFTVANAISAGGINITGYRVTSGGTTYDLTETSKQLTNLTVGTTYNFTVQTDISGEYSVAQSFPPITPIDTVPAPVNLFGYPGVRTANLEWNLAYPYLNVTGYRIHNGGTTYTVGPNKKTTITGLDISAAYSFTIETDISGVYSSTASFGTLTTFTPPKSSGLSGAPVSFTSLSLSWTPPVAWVAVGSDSDGIVTSADGTNWTPVANNPFDGGSGFGVAYNGSYWVAVGESGGSTVNFAKSIDGVTWTPPTNNPFSGNQGVGIAWNGSYWIATGTNLDSTVCIAKSTNGMTWTDASNNPFSGGGAVGAAWNGSYWIVVGESGDSTVSIAKSFDGMTWTDASNNPFFGDSGRRASGIAWNGSYWVAVGYSEDRTVCIAVSTDGMTWTASTNNPFAGGMGLKVAYGGGLWVAVGNNGPQTICIATSIDGMNWTPSNNNPFTGGSADGIAWNGSYWVATGSVGIATSTDGMNWTVSNNVYTGLYSVGAGRSFTITGYRIHSDSPSLTYNIAPASSRIITGLSGTYNFTIQTDVSGDYSATAAFPAASTLAVPPPKIFVRPRVVPTEIQYYWNAPALYVAGGETENRLAYSLDGNNWLASTSGNSIITSSCYAIGYGNGLWVAGGQGTSTLAYSTDGIIWTGSESGTAIFMNICFTVAYGNGKWVAGGTPNTSVLAYSTDGINWTGSESGNSLFTDSVRSVAYGNGLWVAGGVGVNQLAYSTDGINWTASESGNAALTNACNSVAYGNGRWVAAGGGEQQLAYSTDGMNWTVSDSGVFSASYANVVVYGNIWVAGGDGGSLIAYSTDGINWTPSENGNQVFASGCYGLTYMNGVWVAVGAGNENSVAYSTDGINWTASTSGSAFFSQGFVAASAPVPATFRLNSVNPSLNYTTAATTLEITGLTTLTDYSFTIQTDLSGGLSAAAPFRTVKTSERPLPVATLTSSNSIVDGEPNITFSWTDPNDYAYFYVYSLRAATGTKNSIYTGTSDYGTLSHSFTGLDPGRTYSFTIRRGNDAGYSSTVSATSTAVFFDPRTVTGLKFWVDAADTAGDGSNVADGTTVTTWYDKSGTANNATGSATLRTDSTGRYMDMSGSSYDLTTSSWIYNQYFNVFVVDKQVGYGTLLGATAASTDDLNIAYDASGIILSTYGDHSALGTAFQTVTAPVNIWCFSNYGGKTAYWNKLVSGKDYLNAASFVTDSLLKLGTYSGKMREVLIYTGVMAEDNRAAIQNYLYTKWFTQPNLIPRVPVDNGCVMWLDATDITTVFQDVNGTVPVTGNAQTVLRWNDKSGYENHMDVSGVTPQYNTITFDGLPGINTSGDISGSIQTAPFLQSGDASLFIVAYTVDTPTTFGYFKHDISGNFGLIGDPNISWRAGPSPNNNIFVNAPDSTPFIFYGTMKKDQLLEGTFVNSTGMQKSYSVEGINVSVTAAPIQLNGVNSVVYGEVIYYNRALTAAEVQQNATYLSNKWGIPIPAEAPFSPPAAPGLQLWLDSADPYTVFEDASGLTIWKDRSGLGNNAMPHGSLAVSDGIVFGGSQYLSLPDGALPQGAYSYYAVAKFVSDSTIIHGGSKDISGQMWLQPGPGPNISYSYDGVTFAIATSVFPDAPPCNAVVWNGSYWLAGAEGGGDNTTNPTIAKSLDGFNWTLATDGCFAGISYSLVWGGDQWVNGGYNFDEQSCIRTSPDGLVWTPSETPPFGGGSGCYCDSVAYNGTYWVAVGTNQNIAVGYIAKSTDGITWTESTNNPIIGNAGGSVVWTGTIWLANGENGRATSTDGMNWTITTAPFPTVSTIAGPAPAPVHNSLMDIKTVSVRPIYLAGGSGDNKLIYSMNGISWTASANGNVIFTDRCSSVAYGNGLWVAGGTGTNQLAYSTDGFNWTASTSGNEVFTSICIGVSYGNGLWVAGGSGTNQLAYSIDGINWTASTSGTEVFTGGCYSIAYGNGKWVAGGYGTNQMAYSTDGISWTPSSSGNTFINVESYAVAYGNGLWLAGGTGTNPLIYSTDGINWNASGSANSVFEGATCTAVAYGNGFWVAGSTGQNRLAYSADGINWTGSTSGNSVFTQLCSTVAYTNGIWLAGGGTVEEETNRLAYSSDGINWTASTSGNALITYYTSVVAGSEGGMYAATTFDTGRVDPGGPVTGPTFWVIGCEGDNRMFTSEDDGMTWTPNTSGNSLFPYVCNVVGYGNGTWVAAGYIVTGPIDGRGRIAYSSNGINWSSGSSAVLMDSYATVSYGNNMWVAGGQGMKTLLYSTDGTSWNGSTNETNLISSQCFTVAYGGDKWVAGGYGTNVMVYSTDGMMWTATETTVFTTQCQAIAYGDGLWVAGGFGTNQLAYSEDGINWTASGSGNSIITNDCKAVAYGDGIWVAGGYGTNQGAIAYSTDGINWTASTSGNLIIGVCSDVSYANGIWMACSNYGVAYSINGINWMGTANINSTPGAVAGLPAPPPTPAAFVPNISTLTDTNVIPLSTETTRVPGWVAVGNNIDSTVCILKSTDGLTWTASTNNPFSGINGRGVAWNGSYWLAVGANTGYTVSIAKSTDGLTWTDSSGGGGNNPFTGGEGYGVAWNGSYWVAVGNNTGNTVCIAKSLNGLTWTAATNNPFSGDMAVAIEIAWNGSYWLSVGYNNENTVSIAKSTDGLAWTDSSGNPFSGGQANGIAWNGLYWIAVGVNTDKSVCIAKSTNGMDWTASTNNPFTGGVDAAAYGIAWNGSYWIAVGNNTGSTVCIAKSTNGMDWTDATDNPFSGAQGYKISWNGSYWIAVGSNLSQTVCIATSTDGMTWTPSTNNPFTGGAGLAVAPGILTLPHTQTVIIESLYNGTGKSLFLNGITGPTDTSTHIQDASNNFIGWDMSGNYMNGTIKEIIVYSAAHTATQRQQVEAYLKAKWYPQTYSPSSMALWLDSTTLTPGRLQTWPDRSGHSDLSQNAIWAQPLCSTDAVTGRQGVQFAADGIANGFTATPFGTTDSWSVFSVQRYDYSSNQYAELENNVCTAYDMSGTDMSDNVITYGTGTDTTSTPSVNEIRFTYTGDAATAEIHKTPVLVEEIVNVSVASEIVNSTLIGRYTAGSLTNNPLRIGFTGSLTPSLRGAMRGYIYEMIVYNRIVAKDEQQALEGYLSWKWGVPLPTTHPYYIAPPLPQTPFTPLQIAGCQLWLDGADTATIDLSGTTVIAWADKSGAGNNTTGFVGAPTYSNGVVFDGESGFTLPNGTMPFGDSSYSIYAIFNIATASDNIIIGGGVDGTKTCVLITGDNSTNLITDWRNSALTSTNAYSPGVTTLFDSFYVSGGNRNQYINGSNGGSDAPGTREQANTDNTIGFTGLFSAYMTGTIKEILVYNTSHSTADRQRVEGYLATKWGLQSSLPVNHPYYLPPPISGPFTPLSITGCQLWLDGVDDTTMNFDGSTVTSWDDKSPLSNDATGVGGLTYSNGAVFDGVDSYFTLPDGTLPYDDTSYTYFLVVNPSTIDITDQIDRGIINGGTIVGETHTTTTLFINQYDDHKCRQDWNFNSVASANTLNVGQQNLVIMQYASGGLRRFFMNSVETSDTPGVERIQENTNNLIGTHNGTAYYSGSISEIIVYDTALSDSQRIKVENYLTAKWNL